MRTILHSDLNNFYASVECLKNPSIRDKPLVVIGSKEDRHGIVLAKNLLAKNAGVKTGDVFWEAKNKCGLELIEVQADFVSYLQVSKAVRKIYEDYSNKIEAFGIDECWIELDKKDDEELKYGAMIAREIRERIKKEIGLTVSIGVSYNKIFAKLGSDIKKPDAETIITKNNFKHIVWPLPVQDLLYVGKSRTKKLNRIGIFSIGELARTKEDILSSHLGKWGEYLYAFANGLDNTSVLSLEEEKNIKSIGNSITVYRDLYSDEEIRMVIYLLVDAIVSRMREALIKKACSIKVHIKTNQFLYFCKQKKLYQPTNNLKTIAECAYNLYYNNLKDSNVKIREIGVSVSDFYFGYEQYDMFGRLENEDKMFLLDTSIDKIRKKYGNNIIQVAIIKKDQKISNLDILKKQIIHPRSFLNKG